jgi:hypothetical protein
MRLSLSLVAVVAFVGVASHAQSDLNGAWVLSFNGPNGVIDADATFKTDGEKLSGTLASPQGEVPFTGTVKGKAFTFSFNVPTPNGDISIRIDGEQEGDGLKGTFDFGQGMGDWTGKRK